MKWSWTWGLHAPEEAEAEAGGLPPRAWEPGVCGGKGHSRNGQERGQPHPDGLLASRATKGFLLVV